MYFVINTTTNKTAIIKEKTYLANYIGCSRATVIRKYGVKQWHYKEFIVNEPDFIQKKSDRGGRNNPNIR